MASGAQSSNTALNKRAINTFWVETLRLEIPYDIVRSDVGVVFQSDIYYLPLQREDLFCFHVTKISENDIEIRCMRGPAYYPDSEGDTGYVIRFYISMTGIDEPPKHADLRTDQLETSVILKTEYFMRKMVDEGYDSYVWQLKIVVKMLEYDNLPDDHVCKAKYDKLFESFKSECVKTAEIEKEMSFLLGCTPGAAIGGIFSGRQNEFFVMIKLTYVKRVSHYSTEIVQYFKIKQMEQRGEVNTEPCTIDLPVVLNFICTGNKTPITVNDLMELYLRSYRFGMLFLRIMCIDYMVENLMDSEFVIDALKLAEMVDDPLLLDKSMDVFIPNLNKLLQSPKWKAFDNESNAAARSVIHAVTYRTKYQGNNIDF